MKKLTPLLILLILLGLILGQPGAMLAQEKASPVREFPSNGVKIYFFYGQTCPHCKKAEAFLEKIETIYPLEIKSYEVFGNKENADLFLKFLETCGEGKTVRVPAIFIGDKVIIGYFNDDTTGKEVEKAIETCLTGECSDPLLKIKSECEECDCQGAICECEICKCETKEIKAGQTINLPLIGNIDTGKISLPLLTVIFGLLDGFNPCAMWVLILLISLLLNVNSKKKIWLVGGTFIAVSGILYYLFMAAWLNLFLMIGYVSLIRILIGGAAAGVGVWRVKDFITWKPGVCKAVDHSQSQEKITERMNKILKPAALPATFFGIVVLAFSVNLIEFFCSAGLPAVYTQVLAMQNITGISRYLYLLLYDFFYMLDDLIVFGVAVFALSKVGFTDKYNRWSMLVGGILILILGILLIFRPELLIFS